MTGRGICFLINLVTPIFLVRYFSQSEYGEYRQMMLILTSFSTILPLGLIHSLFYFLPSYPKEKRIYLSQTILFMFFTGLAFFLLFYIFNKEIAVYLKNNQLQSYHIYLSVAVVMLSLSLLIETVLVVDNKAMLSTQIMTCTQILRMVIILFCGILGGVIYIVYGLMFLYALKTIGSIAYFRIKYDISCFALKMRNSIEHLKYAIPLGMGGVFGWLSEIADKYIVSNQLGIDTFAVYAVGCYELPFIAIIFSSIADVTLPNVVKYQQDDAKDKVVNLWHYTIEVSMLVAIPLFISFFVFADQFIITVFTKNYAAAVPVFRIALLTVLLEATRYGMITRAYAKTGFMFIVSLIALLFMIPSCYFGILHYGIIGAITSVMASRLLMVSSEIIYSRYILSLAWHRLLPFVYMIKVTSLSLVAAILTYLFIKILPEMNDWIQLFVIFSTFFIIYAYITYLFKCWKTENLPIPQNVKRMLNNFLPNRHVI
jgi:O-antigen/teichoic acid export membrane protein